MAQKKILTLPEVAEITRVPLATLRFYRATNQGPKTWKLGGRVVAYEEDIQSWLDEQYAADEATDEAAV